MLEGVADFLKFLPALCYGRQVTGDLAKPGVCCGCPWVSCGRACHGGVQSTSVSSGQGNACHVRWLSMLRAAWRVCRNSLDISLPCLKADKLLAMWRTRCLQWLPLGIMSPCMPYGGVQSTCVSSGSCHYIIWTVAQHAACSMLATVYINV
jgi:hypothetical protein